jgi:hypothetical protein
MDNGDLAGECRENLARTLAVKSAISLGIHPEGRALWALQRP